MDFIQTRNILEACLLVAGRPMTIKQLVALFEDDIDKPAKSDVREALVGLQAEYEGRGIELVEVASGWRLQSRNTMEHWVSRLFEEKSPRYSRALLETLVLIAYRQPVTRGEIEEVRGVAVSSNIIRTLQERQWIREVGHKDVPGKPALLGTTREFLDYFNLKQLEDLPPLGAVMDMEQVEAVLAAEIGLVEGASDSVAANDETGENADAVSSDEDATSGDEVASDAESTSDGEVASDEGGNQQPATSALVIVDGNIAGEQSLPEAEPEPDIDGLVGDDENAEIVSSVEADSETEVDAGAHSEAGAETVAEAEIAPEIGAASSFEEVELSNEDFQARAVVPFAPVDLPSSTDTAESAVSNEAEILEESTAAKEEGATEDVERTEPESDARLQLRQVIDNFASEHQQEIDARDEFEARNLTSRTPPESGNDDDSGPAADLGSEEVETANTIESELVEAASLGTSISESEATLAIEESRPELAVAGGREAMSSMASRPTFLRIVRNEPQPGREAAEVEVSQDADMQRDSEVQQPDEPAPEDDVRSGAETFPPALIEIPTAIIRESQPAASVSLDSESLDSEALASESSELQLGDSDEDSENTSPPDPEN